MSGIINRIASFFSPQPVALGDSLTEITEKNKNKTTYGPHYLYGLSCATNDTARIKDDAQDPAAVTKVHDFFKRHEFLFQRIPSYGKAQAEHGGHAASIGAIKVGPLSDETAVEKNMNCQSLQWLLQSPLFMKVLKEKRMEGVWLSAAPSDVDPEHYVPDLCEVAVHWGTRPNYAMRPPTGK